MLTEERIQYQDDFFIKLLSPILPLIASGSFHYKLKGFQK